MSQQKKIKFLSFTHRPTTVHTQFSFYLIFVFHNIENAFARFNLCAAPMPLWFSIHFLIWGKCCTLFCVFFSVIMFYRRFEQKDYISEQREKMNIIRVWIKMTIILKDYEAKP